MVCRCVAWWLYPLFRLVTGRGVLVNSFFGRRAPGEQSTRGGTNLSGMSAWRDPRRMGLTECSAKCSVQAQIMQPRVGVKSTFNAHGRE